MAAKVLEDILNNYLSVDSLLEWLTENNAKQGEDIFLKNYECSQVEFVSYFFTFLRQQSSRNFQVYDVETPRKNTHTRKLRNVNSFTEQSSPHITNQQNNSAISANQIDLESLHSFPTLSSSASSLISESTPNQLGQNTFAKENLEKKGRRIKLFSETLEASFKENESIKKDIEYLDVSNHKCETRFAISTPKPLKNDSLSVTSEYLNYSDVHDYSSKLGSRSHWKNHSSDLSSPEANFFSPKSRSFGGELSYRSKETKTSCKMSLGDFILTDLNSSENKKEKKSKVRKRINPIKLSSPTINEKTDYLSDNCNKPEQSLDEGLNVENKNHNKEFDLSAVDSKIVETAESLVYREPELEYATFTDKLNILSKIYSFLISENFCQNIMMELCFIISLLVIEDCDKKNLELESDTTGEKFFRSVHNCVYFAVETLWLQRQCLTLLSLSALKLLMENIRVEKFNVELKNFLVKTYSQRQADEEMKRHRGLMNASMQENVSFQYETDNRENFTSNISFHSFRKQRDLFYNILAIWEANHLVGGWIFSIGLGSKIRSLLSISSDPINMLHLARLFRNQLVMSCCEENQTEEDFNEEILQLLPSADPNKILRLRARLTSSPKRKGPCPLPDFTGHQEFYKDFILCTNHGTFHEHLKNSLCDEILRLNDTDLIGDIEDEDSSLDEQTEERYFQCTNVMRLLAKFLGFVEFLPYRGEKTFTDRVLNIHCSVRCNVLPLFDVTACLVTAVKKKKLTLTLPWVVSYLSMIDPYSARLKPYKSVWRFIIVVYKALKSLKNARNRFYLRLTLGWIFQLPNFPQEMFYTVLDDHWKNSSDMADVVKMQEDEIRGLDSFEFIRESVLYALCPYLNEINVILSENSGCNVRHIRPVTTQESNFLRSQASKQLELRLEGNFLHNQSSSTRKTVEFVTERVASIAIKHLVHNVIPKIKESCWAELDSLSADTLKSESISESCYKKLLTVCEKENWDVSLRRSEIALNALLGNDLERSVVDICAKIVTRQATEKVERWMQSHVTLAMVNKEFESVVKKRVGTKKASDVSSNAVEVSDVSTKDLYHLSTNGRGVCHEEKAWPASRCLKTLRELICKACEGVTGPKEVEALVTEIMKTVRHRDDMIAAAEKTLLCLTLDLIIMHCVHSEENLKGIFTKYSLLLKSLENQSQCNLERIICCRNVAIVSREAANKERAWQNLGELLSCLLEEGLLTRENVETQLASLLRHSWEKEDAAHYSKFLSEMLKRYLGKNGLDKFSLFLEFLMDTFGEEESKTDSLG